jgi:hypothetical protein
MLCVGSFAGSVINPVPYNSTYNLYFRGRYILNGVVDTLMGMGLGTNATTVIWKGCSAGGSSAFFHADFLYNTVKAANRNAQVQYCDS